jgi:hypothetical protein
MRSTPSSAAASMRKTLQMVAVRSARPATRSAPSASRMPAISIAMESSSPTSE